MNALAAELKNKKVRIRFTSDYYAHGGVAAADYTVGTLADGFLKLKNETGNTVFCRLDQIRQITLLSDSDYNDGGTE